MSTWWSAHTHSQFSTLDGMTPVPDMVAKAAAMGQPALGLSDHGNMAGTVQLYKAARKHGIKPFPGVEAYLLDPDASLEDKKAGRFHIGLLALNRNGLTGIMGLVNSSHTRPRFNRFPRITLDDLAELSESAGDDVAVMTGCYFGYVQQALVHDGPQKAENITKMYASLFPHTYVELQNHAICHDQDGEHAPETDDDIVAHLVEIAGRLGLPVIATQDSHYLDQNDRDAHALMKRMVYGGADDAFPGDSFHLASDEWVGEHYDPDVWAAVEDGMTDLLSKGDLVIPPLDTFKAQIPSTVKDPMRTITRICVSELEGYAPAKRKRRVYEERLKYELDIISDLGMGGYFMVVRNYVEWCNEKNICIEARGSANGSLVCYLLGITQVDPIKWNLLFDRFLSRDRIKPPDVDMDIEDVQRERLIGYLQRTFDTMRIGTWGKLGVREDGKGSVLQTYVSYLTRGQDKDYKQHVYASIRDIRDVEGYNADDYSGLMRLGKMGSVYRSYGVHAGGILLSGKDQRIDEYVPKMLVASSGMCVAGETELSLVGRKPTRSVEELYRILHGRYGEGPDTECYGCRVALPPLKQPRHRNHTDARLCQPCKNVKSRVGRYGLVVEGRSIDGTIKPETLVDVVYNGVKSVHRVRLASGHEITATEDHRHLTDTGWCHVRDLKRGDRVAIRGNPQKAARRKRTLAGKLNNFSRRLILDVATRAGRVCEHCAAPEPVNGTHDLAHKTYDGERTADQFLYLCRRCHVEFDRNSRSSRYSVGIPVDYSEVISIRAMGTRHVYDVCMDSPDHSWVGNGVVTHNSASQYDMDDVEQLGYLKLDILGQATLSVMRQCQEHLGRDNPTDFSWIPDNDRAACKILREGRTENGIFHFEGYSKAKGGKKMGIKSTMDAVIATGLFMPGAMNTGQTDLYIERRRNPDARSRVKYIHPAFEAALKDTYGAVIFQEQVINIMRGLGMSIDGINTFFKVVKDSGGGAVSRNNKRMAEVRAEFDQLCVAAGIAEADIDKAWDSTAGFVSYGFNRAHATGYGLRSYRCAYLKAHYPLEFMAALLQVWAGKDKETVYVREARRIGIRILAPDVNISGMSWTLDRHAKVIRRGLISIKGVGMAAAENIASNAPYASVQDLIDRTESRSVTGGKNYAKDGTLNGVLLKLQEAGALKNIEQ